MRSSKRPLLRTLDASLRLGKDPAIPVAVMMDHASERVCHQSLMGLLLAMVDLKLEVPASGRV